MARAAEECGFDSIWVGDHMLYRGDGRPERGPWDAALLTELSDLMRDASICGLGQAAPNPLLCVLKFFPDELTKPLGHW